MTGWRLVGTERVPVEPVYAEAMPTRPQPTEWVTRYQWEMKVSAMTETPEPPATMTEDRAALVGRLCQLTEEADGSQRFKDVCAAFIGGHGTQLLAALAMQPPGYDAKEHALVFLQSECAAQLAALRNEIDDTEQEVSVLERQRNAAERRAEAALGLLSDIREAADRIVNLSDSETADGDEARRVCIQITDKIDAIAGGAAEVKS